MTIKQAQSLKRGQIIYHQTKTNADGTPQRWKVTRENKPLSGVYANVRVHIKRGIHEFDTIDDLTVNEFYIKS